MQVSHTSLKSIGRAKNCCEILTASEESGEANPTGKQPGTFTSDSLANKTLELRIQLTGKNSERKGETDMTMDNEMLRLPLHENVRVSNRVPKLQSVQGCSERPRTLSVAGPRILH